jgi:exodeoxyribonuclease-5
MTQLSAQQLAGIQKIQQWYSEVSDREYDGFDTPGRPFRLFGYAGTGKTTMAREIPEALGLGKVVYGTFTGKAAHVLRSKGAEPVSTIHSAIYLPTTSAEARRALDDARTALEQSHERRDGIEDYISRGELEATDGVKDELTELHALIARLEAQIPELEAAARRLSWELNPMAEWASAELIILDEVSMVNGRLAQDVESFGVPVLVLGDPAQLPPVEGGGYYTNATPDHLLTEIHRSALENPITAMATRIRESTGPGLGLTKADRVGVSVRHAMEHDQVLVWSNKRRWSLIKAMRQLKGFPEGVPVPGDRIMCLTNNKDMAVFNGQQFEVVGVTDGLGGPSLDVVSDEGVKRTLNAFSDGFLGMDMQTTAKNSGAGQRGNRMLATFAQAITVHKAQGSEWDSVYVFDETPGMISMTSRREGPDVAVAKARQWAYTAATRARQTLTLASLQA